jgi:hypothetical protein
MGERARVRGVSYDGRASNPSFPLSPNGGEGQGEGEVIFTQQEIRYRIYNGCQKFFPLWLMLKEPKSPLTPLWQRGELQGIALKVPFEKGGFRGI